MSPLELAKQKALRLAKQHLRIAIDFMEQDSTRLHAPELEMLLMHIDAARELLTETLQDSAPQAPAEPEKAPIAQDPVPVVEAPEEPPAAVADATPEQRAPRPEPAPLPKPVSVAPPKPIIPPVEALPPPEPTAPPQPAEPPARPVSTLADRFSGRTVLNENLARPAQLGASPALPPIRSLAKALSINDFRLFANELFDGRTDTLRELVQRIDLAASLPNALDVLQEYYHGSPDNSSLSPFIALIERRFSS
ncbi:MAG: hypothetical protein CSA07_04590 [Bacteroidia bacterium]|nr:MAG: hypothetical protein CSA07_04590 [Bacteroidia bacterium]